MKNKLGFTLLELLVVVLIIGILASIALPQYRRSVEKAKLTEALLNIKTIEGSIQRYILAHGEPSTPVFLKDFLDVDLSGGEWNYSTYITKDFEYDSYIVSNGYRIEIYRWNNDYAFLKQEDEEQIRCITESTDMGRYICRYLETQGFEYSDTEL